MPTRFSKISSRRIWAGRPMILCWSSLAAGDIPVSFDVPVCDQG